MKLQSLVKLPLSSVMIFLLAFCPAIGAGSSSLSRSAISTQTLEAQIATIEKVVDEKRAELGVPGAALAIVKDDKVILSRGFGFRDAESKIPAVPDTQFAIGSCTKAFTAMLAMMSVDDKKLSLDDAPRKYLPYFKLGDPDIDSNVTVRDLLSHRSGLSGTDLLWYTGALNREEVIRAVAVAKPTAKLRERFQYQNVMYSAAGETIARAQNSTWEQLIRKRILDPLGMKHTSLTVKAMQSSQDHARGYELELDTKKTRPLPMRDLSNIAPAGAINSSVNDMSRWLRLMLSEGVFEGKRLVSGESFSELYKPEIAMSTSASYGLGWAVIDWKGHKVATHSGGIDGFASLVGLMPDQKLGFVLLTNVSGSPLGAAVMSSVFGNLVSTPAVSTPLADLQREVGKYRFAAAGFDIDIAIKEGKLVANVPGQPQYTLENVGGRKYKIVEPPVAGFFMTFRPVKGDDAGTEMYLEQPQGNYVLPRTDNAIMAEPQQPEWIKNLIGRYKAENGFTAEVKLNDGKVVMVVAGQQPYPLYEKQKDLLSSPLLPDSYSVEVKRDDKSAITGIALRQPEGTLALNRIAEVDAITVEELMRRVIEASGGEANLRRHESSSASFSASYTNQGVTADGRIYSASPARMARETTLAASGKKLGTIYEYFDGTEGGVATSFREVETLRGKRLAAARIDNNFHWLLDWKGLFRTTTIKAGQPIDGDETYAIELTPENGPSSTIYVSQKSFQILRRDRVGAVIGDDADVTASEFFSDYRNVDGVMVPFKIRVRSPSLGEAIILLTGIRFNAQVPNDLFKKPARGL